MDAAAFAAVTFNTPSSRTFSIKTVDIDVPFFSLSTSRGGLFYRRVWRTVRPYLARSGDSRSVSLHPSENGGLTSRRPRPCEDGRQVHCKRIVVKTVSKVSRNEGFVLMAVFDAALTLLAL
jgi:hypothetical protein